MKKEGFGRSLIDLTRLIHLLYYLDRLGDCSVYWGISKVIANCGRVQVYAYHIVTHVGN